MKQELSCPLCQARDEQVLWRNANLRVVLVGDADYPGCRVILNAHVREMTDLDASVRINVMAAVFAVERVLRDQMMPDKINLASLGNQVPHLHWHVIPRFADDAHFPDPIWATRRRDGRRRTIDINALAAAIARALELIQSNSD